MDQITAIFENINWDEVMTVVADYVSKIEIKTAFDNLKELFFALIGEFIPGGLF